MWAGVGSAMVTREGERWRGRGVSWQIRRLLLSPSGLNCPFRGERVEGIIKGQAGQGSRERLQASGQGLKTICETEVQKFQTKDTSQPCDLRRHSGVQGPGPAGVVGIRLRVATPAPSGPRSGAAGTLASHCLLWPMATVAMPGSGWKRRAHQRMIPVV